MENVSLEAIKHKKNCAASGAKLIMPLFQQAKIVGEIELAHAFGKTASEQIGSGKLLFTGWSKGHGQKKTALDEIQIVSEIIRLDHMADARGDRLVRSILDSQDYFKQLARLRDNLVSRKAHLQVSRL
jgi:hypothetical protein